MYTPALDRLLPGTFKKTLDYSDFDLLFWAYSPLSDRYMNNVFGSAFVYLFRYVFSHEPRVDDRATSHKPQVPCYSLQSSTCKAELKPLAPKKVITSKHSTSQKY
jgi:hypothetical protein